ncbi:MAG: sodium:solute symporter [Oceanospirillaceae bacterium]|nr:sodium:solute symporter [Oceanospirillaceae bacterium]
MFSPLTVTLIVLAYMALLFAIAQFAEKRAEIRGPKTHGPWVYSLSLAVFATSWTFYGSVGLASQSGLLFFGIYLGALIAIACWWIILRRMVAAKETFHITSIADFISTRYNRSQPIAAVVTLIALIGSLPYIALQLEAVISSFNLITARGTEAGVGGLTGLLVTLVMAIFTILFGARRLDPTERHPGMVTVLAVECLVKLVAFIAIGLFVTLSVFGGVGELTERLFEGDLQHLTLVHSDHGNGFTWLTFIVLSFAGVQLLPRQFHVAVVENPDQRYIKTAMWVFPLYLILINLFVLPIAGAGLVSGLPVAQADFYVLLVPQRAGEELLTLLTFLGGYSAATAMVLVTTMTLATMASNHLLLPLLERIPGLQRARGSLLQVRWLMIVLILLAAYWFAAEFGSAYLLVTIGLLSFAAVLQFAPSMFGGLFWARGNSAGALLGLCGGFLVWFYTLALPTFVRQGWIDPSLLSDGPWGLSLLRPEALLGVEGLPALSHSVLWSMVVNIGLYVLASLVYVPHKSERTLTNEFLASMHPNSQRYRARSTGLEAYIGLEPKMAEAEALLTKYLSPDKAYLAVNGIAEDLRLIGKSEISIIELIEFHRMLEHVLAGAIGAASAHHAIEASIRYSDREASDLKALYSHLVSELHGQHLTTRDTASGVKSGKSTTDHYGMINELQRTIEEQQQQLAAQEAQIASLEAKLEGRYEEIFNFRLEAQRLRQENELLRHELGAIRTSTGNAGETPGGASNG